MNKLFAGAALLALVCTQARPDEKTAGGKTGTNVLVGNYVILAGERDGKKLNEGEFKGSLVVFEENRVIGTDKEKKEFFGAIYTLDTSKKPWAIHMKSTAPKGGLNADGLVHKDGDTVKLIYNLPGGAVPKDFTTKEKQHLFVLKKMAKEKN